MYGYFNRFGRSVKDGIEILKYKITLPEFEGKTRMTAFYQQVSESVLVFCEDDLKTYALREYERNEGQKNKFHYPTIVYLLEGRVTYDDGQSLFVRLDAQLYRRGEKEKGVRNYDAHGWSLSDERLMPPWEGARVLLTKGRLPRSVRRARGVYISEGRLFVCGEDGVEEIAAEEEIIMNNE